MHEYTVRLLDRKLNVIIEKQRTTYKEAMKLAMSLGASYSLDEPPTIKENRIALSTKSKKYPVIHIITVRVKNEPE